MKKVFSTLVVFTFLVGTLNVTAKTVEDKKKDCHAYACMVVAQYEDDFGGSVADLEAVYDLAYSSC